ncbi:hypothetical protein FZEAL_2813 [Fusarium zealandicum]|uniref:F-box domain-containing protein n=1 Tax=Fusarium zealandicum TaxID=1053134 RepID=A0A8H4XN75_9HYPO|nr:hypothetical protein FZEAL_2813 [Fusarium zealandicum]
MPDEPAILDSAAVTFLADPFELVPVIRDILRTRYCVPGSILLVEGLERVAVSRSGRWQAVRLLLGDGVLCIQALLGGNMHRFVQTGEVALGSYIRCEEFHAEWQQVGEQAMVTLVVEDLVTVGWNESYRALQKGQDSLTQPVPELDVQPHQDLTSAQPEDTPKPSPRQDQDFDDDDEAAAEEAFQAFETLTHPSKPKTPRPSVPKSGQPIALPRDWHDPQAPLKLTTLRSIPHLPYKQNWSCNVLAIIASLSPIEPSNLPPHRQRTARLADPSTSKQVHLTVFLDPEEFNPRIGSAVLLVGVKNHRFDGGSLKKYESDRKNGKWWFEDPVELAWCDVDGIKAWWSEVTESTETLFSTSANTNVDISISKDHSSQKLMTSPGHLTSQKAAIDRFLSDLSSWDLLYLRDKIRNTTITLSGLDDLPLELIGLVLSFLDLDDYRACNLVSKAWHRSWTHDGVLGCALRQFFPGLMETYPSTLSKPLFSLALKKRLKWQQTHRRCQWIPWDEGLSRDFTEPPTSQTNTKRVGAPYPFMYANNKLAWQPQLDRVIVDDLQTRVRQRYLPPGGAQSGIYFQLAAISDQLVVLVENAQPYRKIFVADLATKEWKTLLLPGPYATAHMEHRTLAVVTKTGQIMVFVWGERTTQLDLTDAQTHPANSERLFGGVPKVLPHPTQPNVVFAVWVYSHKPLSGRSECVDGIFKETIELDKRLCSFVVVKFEDGRAVWQATESIANPLQQVRKECFDEIWLAMSFSCQKSDNYGSFALGIYRIQERSRSKPQLCVCCEPLNRQGDWGAITFNTLSQTFKHHEYKSERLDLVWDGDTLDPILMMGYLLFAHVHLWNEDLLLAATTPAPDEYFRLHLNMINRVGNRTGSSSYWTSIPLRTSREAERVQVFQDDDFVIVPTLGGVSIIEPTDSPLPPGALTEDDFTTDPITAGRQHVRHWPSTTLVEIKHRPIMSMGS